MLGWEWYGLHRHLPVAEINRLSVRACSVLPRFSPGERGKGVQEKGNKLHKYFQHGCFFTLIFQTSIEELI